MFRNEYHDRQIRLFNQFHTYIGLIMDMQRKILLELSFSNVIMPVNINSVDAHVLRIASMVYCDQILWHTTKETSNSTLNPK